MQIRRLGFVELPDHQHVEQRVAAQVARSAHRSHQRFEWAVLICDRFEAGEAGFGEQRPETCRRIDGLAQHQGVDQEADGILRLRPVASGDEGAEREVGLPCQAVQQGLNQRRRHSERSGGFGLRQPVERRAAPGVKGELDRSPAKALPRRPAMVGG